MLGHPAAKLSRSILRNKANLTALAPAEVHFQNGLVIRAAAFFLEHTPKLTDDFRRGFAALSLCWRNHLLDIGVNIERGDIVVELVHFTLRE